MHASESYVLVVDDMADAADTMALLLTLWGHPAAARYCGPSALVAARAHPPAAVLLDIGMGAMNGFVFAARLRALPGCERVPMIVISGYTSPAFLARAEAVGIAEYLLKPADPTEVRTLLLRLCPGLEKSRVASERLPASADELFTSRPAV